MRLETEHISVNMCKVPAAWIGMQEGQTSADAAAQAGRQSLTDALVTHAGDLLQRAA